MQMNRSDELRTLMKDRTTSIGQSGRDKTKQLRQMKYSKKAKEIEDYSIKNNDNNDASNDKNDFSQLLVNDDVSNVSNAKSDYTSSISDLPEGFFDDPNMDLQLRKETPVFIQQEEKLKGELDKLFSEVKTMEDNGVEELEEDSTIQESELQTDTKTLTEELTSVGYLARLRLLRSGVESTGPSHIVDGLVQIAHEAQSLVDVEVGMVADMVHDVLEASRKRKWKEDESSNVNEALKYNDDDSANKSNSQPSIDSMFDDIDWMSREL